VNRYADDWEGYCDQQADARELTRDQLREPYECDACFELLWECKCPTLPLDEEEDPA